MSPTNSTGEANRAAGLIDKTTDTRISDILLHPHSFEKKRSNTLLDKDWVGKRHSFDYKSALKTKSWLLCTRLWVFKNGKKWLSCLSCHDSFFFFTVLICSKLFIPLPHTYKAANFQTLFTFSKLRTLLLLPQNSRNVCPPMTSAWLLSLITNVCLFQERFNDCWIHRRCQKIAQLLLAGLAVAIP